MQLLRERIRTLEEGLSSKEEALAQQTARVQGLQGSLEGAQAALHAAGKDTHAGGGPGQAQTLHRQQSLEARLAKEQVPHPRTIVHAFLVPLVTAGCQHHVPGISSGYSHAPSYEVF